MPSSRDDEDLLQDFFGEKNNFQDEDDDYEDDVRRRGYGSRLRETNSEKYNSSKSYIPSSSRSRSKNSSGNNSRQPIEDELLKLNHRHPNYINDLQKSMKYISKSFGTTGVAVVFVLHIFAKRGYDSRSDLTPEDELLILEKTRMRLKNAIFSAAETEYKYSGDFFRLVKFDDHRVFIIASDPESAMKWTIRARFEVNKVQTAKAKIEVSSGCELGKIFELRDDYFGNPVNVASKLAEDIAVSDQLLVSFGDDKRVEERHVYSFSRASFASRTRYIAGVTLEYYIMTSNGIEEGAVDGTCTCCGGGGSSRSSSEKPSDSRKSSTTVTAKRQDIVMVQSDMSGFTRLTKKYNILHYMTLILHCRRIFKECMAELHKRAPGSLFKFEGDNIVCKFEDVGDAVFFVTLVNGTIKNYNIGKPHDYQISIKFAIAKGTVLITREKDIAGEQWDLCCTLVEDRAEIGEILVTNEIWLDACEEIRHLGYEFSERSASRKVPVHYNLVFTD